MPIMWTFERLLESPARIAERERERYAMEQRDHDDDDGAPPVLRCRVCGHEEASRYCPLCLADTMEPPA